MAYRYTPADISFVTTKMREGFTQKDINLSYHFWRTERGTETRKGDYTNFISKLSKESKHREKTFRSVHDTYHRGEVVRKIQSYLNCSNKKAAQVYKRNIVPVCVKGYHDPNNISLISILNYGNVASTQRLYIIFTTANYRENMNLGKDDPKTDELWTVETSYTWGDIVDGDFSRDVIQMELNGYAKGGYEPELVNVCVVKY